MKASVALCATACQLPSSRFSEPFSLARFRELLGVPPGAYERGNDFIKRVIDPAMIEVNGLSEYGVRIDVDRAYSRAPITGVTLGWWKKEPIAYRAMHAECQRSKLGRMERLKSASSPALPLLERMLTLLPKP